MQYFSDMLDKCGFSDGSSIPAGAELYREVYCRALNRLLIKHKSDLRVVPFERVGVHNPLLIGIVQRKFWDSLPLKDRNSERVFSRRDDIPLVALHTGEDNIGWSEAVDEAMEMGLDSCVINDPVLNTEYLDKLLEGLPELEV